MTEFTLDSRLQTDCHELMTVNGTHILLMDNADYSWFILVPETDEIEFYRLQPKLQQRLLEQVNWMSRFVVDNFDGIAKLNVATLGNVVAQLHIHVIGRRHDDAAWPAPVWGVPKTAAYTAEEVARVRDLMTQQI